jgi:hypothetical protein
LWRDHYRFALCPDRVLYTHRKRFLRERVENRATWAAGHSDGAVPPWRTALEALRQHLPAATNAPRSTSFVLSSHFCHFALLRKQDELTGHEELLAYARHKMKVAFGGAVGDWVLKLSIAGERSGHVASAVDSALLDEIRTLCRERNLRPVSICPYLAVAFNRCRKTLEKRTAWFVVHEDGRVVVSLFRNGNWASLASRRVGPQWKLDLSNVLDREQQLVEVEGTECNQVLLYALEPSHAGDFRGSRYQVELLRPDPLIPLGEAAYAMAA